MHRFNEPAPMREELREWRIARLRIAFVPTMGNLHSGHISLIERARELADRVVASVFVNPTQFGPSEDYGAYPRTLERDAEFLKAAGTDVLFTPTIESIYPSAKPRPGSMCPVFPEYSAVRRVPGISAAWRRWSRACSTMWRPMSRSSARRTTSSCC